MKISVKVSITTNYSNVRVSDLHPFNSTTDISLEVQTDKRELIITHPYVYVVLLLLLLV